MMIGETETKENFKYLSKHGIRSTAQIFISNPKKLNELVDFIPENVMTGFHLKDIFDNSKSQSDIQKKIYDTILFNKRFAKSLEISKQIVKGNEEKDEKDEKKKVEIDFDLAKFLKDNNAADCINKLQKKDMFDSEIFFKIDIGELEGCLDLKPEGKKHKLMKTIKELREKFEKESKISYVDAGLLEEPAALGLKMVKSHTLRMDKKEKM